jgi:CRISPR-associated protein Cas2
MDERTYIVAYDIRAPKRWRRVFKLMQGFGSWLQLSLFQCRLSSRRRAELEAALDEEIRQGEDHILILDLGPADRVELSVKSLGRAFTPMKREATII